MNKAKQIFILIMMMIFLYVPSISNAIDLTTETDNWQDSYKIYSIDYPVINWPESQKKNFLVTWTVTNTWIIPCNQGPLISYDEYGRKTVRNTMTLQVCYDSEALYKEKEFYTYREAEAFVNNAKKICKETYDCGISDFEIIGIKQ